MSKRQAPSPEAPSAPKRPSFTQTAQLDIGPASGEEDLKLKILQVQNAKLSERLQERNHRRAQDTHNPVGDLTALFMFARITIGMTN